MLNRKDGFRDHGLPEEYCRGFQVFDKDMTGFIGVGQLRYSTLLYDLRLIPRSDPPRYMRYWADKLTLEQSSQTSARR